MKNLANVITALRMVFAAAMLFTPSFSAYFWACYLGAGVSDILDGIIARAMKQESEFGAKLDSIADLVFAAAVAAVIFTNTVIPVWLWICSAAIAALRFASYVVGYRKYRAFSALHTYANKLTGGAIFLFPVLYTVLGMETGGIILCVIAFLSSFEELMITIRSTELNRDCKSIFF